MFDVVCNRRNGPIALVDPRFAKKRGARFFFELQVRLSRNDSHAERVVTYGHQTRYMRGDIITRALFNPDRESCATGSVVWDPVFAAVAVVLVTTGDQHSAIASTAHNPGRCARLAKLAHFLNVPGLSPELTTPYARTAFDCVQ